MLAGQPQGIAPTTHRYRYIKAKLVGLSANRKPTQKLRFVGLRCH